MKKNIKGFTLIELLAIIVILAIIAVITVPIILNVIENSKKGSVIDSAYGYKDAVQNHYVSKSVINANNETPTGVKTVSELETDGLEVSGEKPSDGWVQLDKGVVVAYSMKFGDYVVSLDATTDTPSSIKNGELTRQPLPTIEEMCPGCVYGIADASIGSALPSGYSENYNSLGNTFLGQIVNNGVITRSFVCGKQDSNVFCLEGGQTSKNNYNINIVSQILTGESMNCSTDSSGNYSCQDHTSSTHCGISTLRAFVYANSNVHLYDDGLDCVIQGNGALYTENHCWVEKSSNNVVSKCYTSYTDTTQGEMGNF